MPSGVDVPLRTLPTQILMERMIAHVSHCHHPSTSDCSESQPASTHEPYHSDACPALVPGRFALLSGHACLDSLHSLSLQPSARLLKLQVRCLSSQNALFRSPGKSFENPTREHTTEARKVWASSHVSSLASPPGWRTSSDDRSRLPLGAAGTCTRESNVLPAGRPQPG